MTKFETDDEPGFVAFIGELRRWIKELAIPVAKEIPPALFTQQPLQDMGMNEELQIKYELCTSSIFMNHLLFC
jgi:hypothetical protein